MTEDEKKLSIEIAKIARQNKATIEELKEADKQRTDQITQIIDAINNLNHRSGGNNISSFLAVLSMMKAEMNPSEVSEEDVATVQEYVMDMTNPVRETVIAYNKAQEKEDGTDKQ